MNKLKFAALGMAALAFVACEKESTDPNGNNGGNGGKRQWQPGGHHCTRS